MRSSLFDSLTADEIGKVSTIVRKAGIGGSCLGFGSVFTQKPDKARLRAGEAVTRQAREMLLDRCRGR